MLLPVAVLLLAIPEPCYGLEGPSQIEGEHLWVEYPNGVSDAQAMAVAEAADTAWNLYAQELGWPEPPEPIAVRADLGNDMAAGQCITMECGGEQVPLCHIFGPAFSSGYAAQTAAHEIGHAFQYALMGSYLDSLTSWAWWMEGSATWLEYQFDADPNVWNSVENYVGNPQWTLHHDFADSYQGPRGGHMYGSAVLAFFLAEYYGGPDTVRATWEWGAERSGQKIFFHDAIEGIGLSFDEVWPHYLATLTVLDLEGGENVAQIPAHTVISELPGSGSPPEASWPEGLGMGIVRVPAELGAAGMDLRVQVDGDPAVPWQAALVRANGTTPGSEVLEHIAAEFDDAGHAEMVLPAFDGAAEAFLAVSPDTLERTPFGYTIAAELVPSGAGESSSGGESSSTSEVASTSTGAAEESGTDTAEEVEREDADGCGCRSGGASGWLLALLVVPALRRRPLTQG